MRFILTATLALTLAASVAFAQCPGMKNCATADKKSGCCGSSAAYSDARTMPSCAPQPMQDFHKVMMPFMEARTTQETIYIRDNARSLYDAAKGVPKSKACCDSFNKKAFKHSAKDLVKACEQLQKIAKDKAINDDAVLTQMKSVEDAFTALSNSCQ